MKKEDTHKQVIFSDKKIKVYEKIIKDETFNLCLKEKGYTKDENGIFELPYLTCNWY